MMPIANDFDRNVNIGLDASSWWQISHLIHLIGHLKLPQIDPSYVDISKNVAQYQTKLNKLAATLA